MFWERLALFILVLFAIIGTGFTSIIVHEYVHYNDFKNFNMTDERLCGFVLPTGPRIANWTDYMLSAAGYYQIEYDDNMTSEQYAEYRKIRMNTEVKAYTIGALIFVLYVFCYMVVTFGRIKDKERILNYQVQIIDDMERIKLLEEYIIQEQDKWDKFNS